MSSGSRSEPLEALLEARFELECCEAGEKAEWAKRFEDQVSMILASHPAISRNDLLEAIGPKYREFKSARQRAQRRRETL